MTETLAAVLNGAATLTTSAAPAKGAINSYDATSGALTPTLPALSGLTDGASLIVEKNAADTTAHTITFTTTGGDTFDDATTTLVLRYTGEKRTLQVVTISGTKQWKVTQVSPSATTPGVVIDNADGTLSVNSINALEPLSTTTIKTTSAAPAIGQTTYYNATSANLTPALPALSGLRVGARLAVRRDPADTSTHTVTLSCAGSDTFYSSGATSTTLPLSGEQREYQVISVSGTKYWAPQGSLNPVSALGQFYVASDSSPHYRGSSSDTRIEHSFEVNVLDYGADPTGVADSTSAFTAALAALPANGGCVFAPGGTYKTSSTITFLPNKRMRGAGQNITVISYTGTGPCLTTSNPTGPNGTQTYYWAFEDFTIDGTNAGTGAMGLRLTNVFNLIVRAFQVRYFQTTGAIGIGYVSGLEPGFQGYQMWTFDAVNLLYNTSGLDFNGGNGSYSQFDVYIQANSNQSGVTSHNVVKNYLNRFRLRGFFGATAATNTGWIFAIDPGNASGTSCWESCSWDIVTQPYAAVTTYPSHQTLVMGSSASILSGPGALEFFVYGFSAGNANGASIATGAQLAVSYLSDPVLGAAVIGYDALAVEGSSQWKVHGSGTTTLASAIHAGNNLRVVDADIQEFLLTNGNTTIGAFQFGSPTNVNLTPPFARGRKVEFLFHQPASGAAGTITWPSNVQWASGNGALSTANGAVDKVRFTYMPANIWYGEINKNYTATPANTAAYLSLTAPKTSAYTAAVGELVIVDCTAGAVTITAPAGAVDGSRFSVKREDATFNSAVVATITRSGSDVFESAGTTSATLTLQGHVKTYQYKASLGIWYAVGADLGLSNLDARYQSAVATNIVPATSDANALGSASLGWKALYLGGTTFTAQLLPNNASVANQQLSLPTPTTDVLVSRTSADTLTNKTLTSPTLTTPALGTPASGNLTNCTFPTLNQSTTGNAATATNLASPQAINGVNFDGSAAITTEWFISNAASAYTLTSQTAAQQMFAVTTNGAITLPVGVFFFECLFALTSMSSTSSSFGFALGGTAVLADQAWEALAAHTLAGGANAALSWNSGANTAIAAASTITNGTARITGKVRVTTSGTLIPQVSLGVAAAAIVQPGSLFRIWKVASTAATESVGNWS